MLDQATGKPHSSALMAGGAAMWEGPRLAVGPGEKRVPAPCEGRGLPSPALVLLAGVNDKYKVLRINIKICTYALSSIFHIP